MKGKWRAGWLCACLVLGSVVLRVAAEGFFKAPVEEGPSEAPWEAWQESPPEEGKTYPFLAYEPPPCPLPEAPGAPVVLDNDTSAAPDVGALLAMAPELQTGEGPQVLIVHTHGTEAYRDSPDWQSREPERSVIAVGDVLAEALEAEGIRVLHCRSRNDEGPYAQCYDRMEGIIAGYLRENPTISMVIDVHRDAVPDGSGGQLPLTGELDGEPAARMLLVMGSALGDLPYPRWECNLSTALKLQSLGQARAPGLFRDLNLRAQRYNQHLTPNSILLEVGTAGNTLEEAKRSAAFFGHLVADAVFHQETSTP